MKTSLINTTINTSTAFLVRAEGLRDVGYILVRRDSGKFSAFVGKHSYGGGTYIGSYDTAREAMEEIEVMAGVIK